MNQPIEPRLTPSPDYVRDRTDKYFTKSREVV